MAANPESSSYCPYFRQAVEVIGRRWTGEIIRALLAGCTRFGDLADEIPGISDRLLSERLKDLEAEGIVERQVIPTTPVRVVYRLTDKGRSLADVLAAIATWGHTWLELKPADAVPAGHE
jgi:DNA-binding HxlR family transcriptional regulator